jgi:toxin ParE1/3/4
MKLIWTKEALEKLFEIEYFIAKDSPKRAEKFIHQIIECGESIPLDPEIGRIVPEISNPSIRELIYRNYRVVYRIRKKTIEIITVFEGHRLLKKDEIK